MSSVILDGFEGENSIGNTLKRLLDEKGEEFHYFKLKDMNILPCRSCGACAYKSPGKCIINDDIHEIMRAIAKNNKLIFLTPVRFGGYSSQLKKVIDRMMPIGMPFYIIRRGHLLHPMRYGNKDLIGIGLAEQNLEGQEENFRTLVANNALNMSFSYCKSLIFKPSDSITKIEGEVRNELGGILQPQSLT